MAGCGLRAGFTPPAGVARRSAARSRHLRTKFTQANGILAMRD
jgi:hypothetical protein